MWSSRGLGVASILIVAAPLVLGGAPLLQNGARGPGDLGLARADIPVFEVKPGQFRGKLVETGWVWVDLHQQMRVPRRGHARIRRIVADGSTVKKDESICELDFSDLKAELARALIAAKEAEIAYLDARRAREAAETILTETTDPKSSTDDETRREFDLGRKRSDEAGKLSAWENAKDKVGDYPAQIAESLTISAPADGLIVLPGQRNPDGTRSLLEKGEVVSGGQELLSVFDVNVDR